MRVRILAIDGWVRSDSQPPCRSEENTVAECCGEYESLRMLKGWDSCCLGALCVSSVSHLLLSQMLAFVATAQVLYKMSFGKSSHHKSQPGTHRKSRSARCIQKFCIFYMNSS